MRMGRSWSAGAARRGLACLNSRGVRPAVAGGLGHPLSSPGRPFEARSPRPTRPEDRRGRRRGPREQRRSRPQVLPGSTLALSRYPGRALRRGHLRQRRVLSCAGIPARRGGASPAGGGSSPLAGPARTQATALRAASTTDATRVWAACQSRRPSRPRAWWGLTDRASSSDSTPSLEELRHGESSSAPLDSGRTRDSPGEARVSAGFVLRDGPLEELLREVRAQLGSTSPASRRLSYTSPARP